MQICRVSTRFIALLLLLPGSLQAASWAQQVDAALSAHLETLQSRAEANGERFHWQLHAPDGRLSFTACSRPPEIQRRSAATSGQVTFAAHCSDRGGYHVPVRVSITHHRKVAVLARPLPRGTQLSPDMIHYRERELSQLTRGHFTPADTLPGMVLRRSLPAGTVLHPGQVTPPTVVQRGDEVIIVAENSAIEVRMKGVAMNPGRIGQQITVRNSHSQRLLRAKVAGAGEVRVAF